MPVRRVAAGQSEGNSKGGQFAADHTRRDEPGQVAVDEPLSNYSLARVDDSDVIRDPGVWRGHPHRRHLVAITDAKGVEHEVVYRCGAKAPAPTVDAVMTTLAYDVRTARDMDWSPLRYSSEFDVELDEAERDLATIRSYAEWMGDDAEGIISGMGHHK